MTSTTRPIRSCGWSVAGGTPPAWLTTAAAGLKVAAAQHPDVVLLDITMPRMDGFEVARQLRLDAPRNACYIIAVTGRGDDECRRKCHEADIDLMLIKPVESSLMKTILMQASHA